MVLNAIHAHLMKGLTLCIQETPKWVLLQTVKTQMKRSINAAFHQGLHYL